MVGFSSFVEEWFPEGKQNILPGPISETLVPGLRPWTVYHLRLFAENQLGKSKEGKVLQVKTFNFELHNKVVSRGYELHTIKFSNCLSI